MQRWQGFVVLNYVIKVSKELFIEKTTAFFSKSRDSEIKEEDPDDFLELIAFKKSGWPNLDELVKKHPTVLEGLIIYHQYEILHLIIEFIGCTVIKVSCWVQVNYRL